MTRYLCACLCLFCAGAAFAADPPKLKQARQRWLKGNYEEARALYEELARDPKLKVAAAVGVSKCHQSQGEYGKALQAVEAALKGDGKSSDLLARKAELLHFLGRWDEAEKAADAALAQNKENLLARWTKAQIYRDRGDLKKADAEFRWFVRYYTQRSNADNDIKDPDELLLVGLAGTENARWNILRDKEMAEQFKFVLNEVYGDALKAEKDFWPAECQAGYLLLEKYNRGEALDAFDKALKINPQAAEALVGKGISAFQKFEFKDAERFAEQALKINPNLPAALRLRADVWVAAGDLDKALTELEQARKVSPRDERTLARVAACYFLQKKQADYAALVKEVEKQDAKPGLFWAELGEQVEQRRRFDDAEKFYQKAVELRPMLADPRNSLGLLYLRLGREKDARDLLDEGFKADPFNVRVANSLKVLRHLDGYKTIKTRHFELRYDEKNDGPLARYLADYLETVYDELADRFNYKPKGPILVEVFNRHDMFSGRVVAVPDLHTIGACTGRMVAMASPHARGVRKPFNWGRVMRHELTHIFNLEQTHFLVPHWVTEGLAVISEGYPRPQIWNQLLLERVPAGDVLNLETIDLAFIRPRSQLEWNLAYCQSQLYMEYLQKQYGKSAVGELLAAYADGLGTQAAIQKVCKVDTAAFEKGYKAYLDDVVKSIRGKPAEKPMTLAQLKDAYAKDPGNADLAGKLAVQFLRRKDNAQARKYAKAALEKKKGQPLASYVMARLETAAGNNEQALKLLQDAVDRDSPEPLVLRELGKAYYEAGEFTKAAEMYELGRKVEPYESQWLEDLARVHAQAGNKGKQIAALKALVPMDADDLVKRKRLARLLSEEGRHAEAEKYAREALEIDVRDKEAREALFKALAAQKKDDEAARMRKVLEN